MVQRDWCGVDNIPDDEALEKQNWFGIQNFLWPREAGRKLKGIICVVWVSSKTVCKSNSAVVGWVRQELMVNSIALLDNGVPPISLDQLRIRKVMCLHVFTEHQIFTMNNWLWILLNRITMHSTHCVSCGCVSEMVFSTGILLVMSATSSRKTCQTQSKNSWFS